MVQYFCHYRMQCVKTSKAIKGTEEGRQGREGLQRGKQRSPEPLNFVLRPQTGRRHKRNINVSYCSAAERETTEAKEDNHLKAVLGKRCMRERHNEDLDRDLCVDPQSRA